MSAELSIPFPESDLAMMTIAAAKAKQTPTEWCASTIHTALTTPPTNMAEPFMNDVLASLGAFAASVQDRAAAHGLKLDPAAGTALASATVVTGSGARLPAMPSMAACGITGHVGPTPTNGWGVAGRPGAKRAGPSADYAERRKHLRI